jgi:hypothetical protein
LLEREYKKDPIVTKERMARLKEETGLEKRQIYKWFYDRRGGFLKSPVRK